MMLIYIREVPMQSFHGSMKYDQSGRKRKTKAWSKTKKYKPEFIARFKYGRKPWKAWVNFLVKNVSVEEYLELAEEIYPRPAMEKLGYKGK